MTSRLSVEAEPCREAEVRGRTRTPAAETRGSGWAGESGLHRPRGGSARGGERGVPPVPPPALPGSGGGGGTGKPRGAPRECHLKGRTTAGGGRSGEGGGEAYHSPKLGGGSGRQASKQTHEQTEAEAHRERRRAGAERGPPRLVRCPRRRDRGGPAGPARARGTR